MSEISRVALFGKLNRLAYQAVEGATVFCKLRGNPYVELVHWLHQILQNQNSDIHRIAEHYKLDPGKMVGDMQRALDALPRGRHPRSRDLSEHLEDATERGWVWGSLLFNASQVRTGFLILGMLKTPRAAQYPFRHLGRVQEGQAGRSGRELRRCGERHPRGGAGGDGWQSCRVGRAR